MGLKTATSLSHYERGAKVPGLKNALKLEIVLHTPAAFLFRELYGELKKEIHERREKLTNQMNNDPKIKGGNLFKLSEYFSFSQKYTLLNHGAIK